MGKTFTLRVDLESDKGIREGLPGLLDLMKKYKIKGSFYLVMGGESGFFELMKHNKKMVSAAERSIKSWSLIEKLRMVIFPRDFVKENIPPLRRILEEGHELGIHGWKHRAWTRGLDKMDVEEHVRKAIKKYYYFFEKKPTSFTAPGFNTNKRVLRILENKGIKFISDFSGDEPKYHGKIKNVPITINGENKMPIIEYLVTKKKTEEEIIRYLKNEINSKNLSSLYIHDLFEARFKLNILEEIFKFVKENKIKNKRIIDF